MNKVYYQKMKEENYDKWRAWRDRENEKQRERKKNLPRKKRIYDRERNRQYRKDRYSNDLEFRKYRKELSKKSREKWKNTVEYRTRHYNNRARRRMEKYGTGDKYVPITIVEMQKLIDITHCQSCGIKLSHGTNAKNGFSIDHIIPLCKGGNNDIENLQVLCKSCNTTKFHKVDHPICI